MFRTENQFRGQGNGAKGQLMAWSEIGHLIISMELLWREARRHAQRATTPGKGYLI
jgi:hypothetical protein